MALRAVVAVVVAMTMMMRSWKWWCRRGGGV
jgi:hypothetical protein